MHWAIYAGVVARHLALPTPDGKWTVEVITTCGRQSFGVKNLHRLPPGSLNAPGRLVRTIAELCAIMGDDYDRLIEVRSGRFDGGR